MPVCDFLVRIGIKGGIDGDSVDASIGIDSINGESRAIRGQT